MKILILRLLPIPVNPGLETNAPVSAQRRNIRPESCFHLDQPAAAPNSLVPFHPLRPTTRPGTTVQVLHRTACRRFDPHSVQALWERFSPIHF